MEGYVEIKKKNGILRGMIHLPDERDYRSPFPGVILYHGFGGNRMEPGALFVQFCRRLLARGIASLRFDFLGSAESDGSFEEMTYSSEVEDALDIFDYFQRRREIDKDMSFLLGLRMGGSIAGHVAGLKKEAVSGLILWSSAGEMRDRVREENESGKTAEKSDPADRKGLRLNKDFVPDVMSLNILETTSRYAGKCLLIHGTGDETVPFRVSEQYKEVFAGRARLELIAGADHTYDSIPGREKLFTVTLDFIQERSI